MTEYLALETAILKSASFCAIYRLLIALKPLCTNHHTKQNDVSLLPLKFSSISAANGVLLSILRYVIIFVEKPEVMAGGGCMCVLLCAFICM